MDIFSHYPRTYCSSCCRTEIADRLISKPFQVKTRKSMSPLFVELLFMTHGPRDANDYTHRQSKFDFTVHICYSKIAAEFTLYRWTFKNIKTRKYKFKRKKKIESKSTFFVIQVSFTDYFYNFSWHSGLY